MPDIQLGTSISQAVFAAALGLCVLASQFEPAERCWRNLKIIAYLLFVNLTISILNLVVEFFYAGGMPPALRLFANVTYTLSVAAETSHVCPVTDRERKTLRLGQRTYPLSWVFMAVFDVLSVIDLSQAHHSQTFAFKLSTICLRLSHVILLFPVYMYPDRGRYFDIGNSAGTDDVDQNRDLEQQEPELAIVNQSIEDAIDEAGGYWPWMKKFWVFSSWVWPRDMPWRWKKFCALSAIPLRLCEVLCNLTAPLIFAYFFSTLLEELHVLKAILILVSYELLSWFGGWNGLCCLRMLLWKRFELERNADVKVKAFKGLMGQEAAFHSANNPIIMNTAATMGTSVCECFDFVFYESPAQILELAMAIAIIWWKLGPQIWLLQTFSIAIGVIVALRGKRGAVPIFDLHAACIIKARQIAQAALQFWHSIYSHGQIGHEVETYTEATHAESTSLFSSYSYAAYWNMGLGLLTTITGSGNMIFLLISSSSLEEALPRAILFYLYSKHLEKPIQFFSNGFQNVFDKFVAADRLRRMLEIVPKIQDGTSGLTGAGKTTALVGRSGAGKTTIFKLLLRQYDPVSGNIERNGQDLKDVEIEKLLEHTAVLEQSPHIFEKSVYGNIRLDCQGISEEEAQEACKKAGIHEDIMKLPQQYSTMLGQGGYTLSGGQKQRLALSRVFAHQGDLILLDEPTSSQDVELEGIIKEAVKELGKSKTVVINTQVILCSTTKENTDSSFRHRLSTIQNADHIVVFRLSEEGYGEVAEEGTHDELLKLEGVYFRMLNKSTNV
ncbi:ABC transporter [Fusarium coicis]|nr:ABC transporter [Fusarium coicis]